MAINDQADIRCANWGGRHEYDQRPPAVAFTPDESMGADGQWWPYCQACLDELAIGPFLYDVAFIDYSSRQRRPNPNHHDNDAHDLAVATFLATDDDAP